MILDDIREKALERLQGFQASLDESDLYIRLKERYDSLSPIGQKLVVGTIAFLFALFLLQFPKAFYDAGSENLALFEENRDLVLDLYKVKRLAIVTPQAAPPMSGPELENRARSAVSSARVQVDQIKGISLFDNAGPNASKFIPKTVTQNGVEIRLANLNLTQVVDIGHALTNMGSAKIVGLDVRAGSVPGNYFDAIFKVVSFNIPAAPAANPPAGRK